MCSPIHRSGSVARVVSACVRSGLDSAASYQSLPLHEGTVYAERNGRPDLYGERQYEQNRAFRQELADVEAELARLSVDEADHDSLVARRNRLTARLTQTVPPERSTSDGRRHQLQQRSADLQHRARDLRSQQSELRRRIADLELDIASCDLGHRHAITTNAYGRHDYHALCRDRDAIQVELDRVTASLDACLSEATQVGRTLRSSSSNGRVRTVVDRDGYLDREALVAELRRIDDRLAVLSRVQWLRARRAELLKKMRTTVDPVRTKSPLADAASRWLVRLSGGRLHRLDWTRARFGRDLNSYHREVRSATGVTINGRDETQCDPIDRLLAATAVRMAAGDLLARTGRHVPLVIELPRDAVRAIEHTLVYEHSTHAFREQGDHLRSNHPLAAALRDYVQSGRQVLVLTSSQELAHQLGRVGARSFEIHTHRVVHPHRPMWRSHYEGETYVGPHPHTYATHDVPEAYSESRFGSAVVSNEIDVNRDFDVAWHESQSVSGFVPNESAANRSSRDGFAASEVARDNSPRTDWARDGVLHRDGFYFADTYTTDPHPTVEQDQSKTIDLAKRALLTPASPFYLSVDSPIDQAPSVDTVAAARLRGLKVTHVTHLMQRDPNRLSDALGMASVDAATIRRWQAECRLACRVPNLRGFDARVLVGCGVTTPGQLAAIHPTDLLHEVEAFLATDAGQQMLLSGTSQELSRIMTWIATANSAADRGRIGSRDSLERVHRRRVVRTTTGLDSEDEIKVSRPEKQTVKPKVHRRVRRRAISDRDAAPSVVVTYDSTNGESVNSGKSIQRELRFYLQRQSPVVDAPSIGPRMAERLEGVGVVTVDDLLAADPETLTADLDHRRVDVDTIVQWQQQATLVCRIPMLRGHDAQLLVAAEVTTPEELAESDAEDLFGVVDAIARSHDGKRILRGGHAPDLNEVRDWIRWASHQRSLRAA